MSENGPRRYREVFPRTMRLKSALTAFVLATLPVLPFFLLFGNLLFVLVHMIVLWAVLFILAAGVYGVLLSRFFHRTLMVYRPDKEGLLRRRMRIVAIAFVWLFLAYGAAFAYLIVPMHLAGVAG